jgi:hypothetical protein
MGVRMASTMTASGMSPPHWWLSATIGSRERDRKRATGTSERRALKAKISSEGLGADRVNELESGRSGDQTHRVGQFRGIEFTLDQGRRGEIQLTTEICGSKPAGIRAASTCRRSPEVAESAALPAAGAMLVLEFHSLQTLSSAGIATVALLADRQPARCRHGAKDSARAAWLERRYRP